MVMVDSLEVEQFEIVESFVVYEVCPKWSFLTLKIRFKSIDFTRGAVAATFAASPKFPL